MALTFRYSKARIIISMRYRIVYVTLDLDLGPSTWLVTVIWENELSFFFRCNSFVSVVFEIKPVDKVI